jgi:hypothetical protein
MGSLTGEHKCLFRIRKDQRRFWVDGDPPSSGANRPGAVIRRAFFERRLRFAVAAHTGTGRHARSERGTNTLITFVGRRLTRHGMSLGAAGGTYRLRAVLRRARAAFRSCCNNSISNGLSIRGFFEVTSFRPGKAVEAESELFPPPVFEVSPMLVSQGANQRIVGGQLGRVRFSGQDGSSDGLSPCAIDVPDKVRSVPPCPMKSSTRRYCRPRSTSPAKKAWFASR